MHMHAECPVLRTGHRRGATCEVPGQETRQGIHHALRALFAPLTAISVLSQKHCHPFPSESLYLPVVPLLKCCCWYLYLSSLLCRFDYQDRSTILVLWAVNNSCKHRRNCSTISRTLNLF